MMEFKHIAFTPCSIQSRRALALSAVAAAALFASAPAFAQTAPAATPAPEAKAKGEDSALDIVVTARKIMIP